VWAANKRKEGRASGSTPAFVVRWDDATMIPASPDPAKDAALVTELAAATYRVAERHNFQSAFIDIALDLWQARSARSEPAASSEDMDLSARNESSWPLQCWI
jgi:hypothetical protein